MVLQGPMTNSHHFDQSIKAEFHYCVFYVPVLTERFKSFYKGVITWRLVSARPEFQPV